MGDESHGLSIIKEYGKLIKQFPQFEFAFKFQYRNLPTFIHDSFKNRNDLPYVKRFNETQIPSDVFDSFRVEARKHGFKLICTPFDNDSVGRIVSEKYDYIKVASCSCSDWPLLEEIAKHDLPIIASTGGASELDIDRLYNFFIHRNKQLTILHCIPEYPTKLENSHLGQISFLKNRYKNIDIGFSTHEEPNDITNILMAIAQGAIVFEKHVGLVTDKYNLNKYSTNPLQTEEWLKSAAEGFLRFGTTNARMEIDSSLTTSLKELERGLFAIRDIQIGEEVSLDSIELAFPPGPNQLRAKDLSKFNKIIARKLISKDTPITLDTCEVIETQQVVRSYVEKVKNLLRESKVTLPNKIDVELSHHYGLDKFNEYGLTIIDVINRDYCKKLLIVLPNQIHPEQSHKVKEETFIILHGELELYLDGVLKLLKAGDMATVNPGVRHQFTSKTGSVIEEISTTHIKNDSFYTDIEVMSNPNRKTRISDWFN